MARKHLTYSQAGVSIDRGDSLVDAIVPLARATLRQEVLQSVGGFAALSRLPKNYTTPLLVVSTDGIGTKVLLALEMKQFSTVGIDLVAMSVNDILTVGAEPLLFLDYLATGRLRIPTARDLVAGVARGCKESACALVGGETAEMPQVYRGDDFDMAGFCVGVVEASKKIDGSRVRAGDLLLGIPSSGVHSNGFSLVRAILKKRRISLNSKPRELRGKTVGRALIEPTRIYVKEILAFQKKIRPHAMAHITGGGLEGNVPRAFPKGLHARIDRGSWKIPAIFSYLQDQGNVTDAEMFKTFNMGIGFVVVVARKDAERALRLLKGSRPVGEVVKGKGEARVLFAQS